MQSKCDYTLFVKNHQGKFTVILVYVDDMVVAGNDKEEIQSVTKFLSTRFHMKDLGELRYFLGIEVDRTKEGIFLCQKKYTLDLLKEYGLLNCRKPKLPLDTQLKLTANLGDPLPHPEEYQKLIGKLIYLTITRPEIYALPHNSAFPVSKEGLEVSLWFN